MLFEWLVIHGTSPGATPGGAGLTTGTATQERWKNG